LSLAGKTVETLLTLVAVTATPVSGALAGAASRRGITDTVPTAIVGAALHSTVIAHETTVAHTSTVGQTLTVVRALALAAVRAHFCFAVDTLPALSTHTRHVDTGALAIAVVAADLYGAVATSEASIARADPLHTIAITTAIRWAALCIFAQVTGAVNAGESLVARTDTTHTCSVSVTIIGSSTVFDWIHESVVAAVDTSKALGTNASVFVTASTIQRLGRGAVVWATCRISIHDIHGSICTRSCGGAILP